MLTDLPGQIEAEIRFHAAIEDARALIDVSHGPGCPKNRLDEAMDSPNGALVRRCFRLLNAKGIGLTITLADITEEEFRVLELIEAERQKQGGPERS